MLLEVKHLDSGYGLLQVLRDVSIGISKTEYVSIIGPNGAGKSTILKSISGLIKPIRGEILFDGKPTMSLESYKISRRGLSYITEELNLFIGMTVRENLSIGAHTIKDRRLKNENLDLVFSLFPRLKDRENRLWER
jgi:branched-chain amino acid transport system ATP-binding protein